MERDPTVLPASERSGFFAGTCLFAHAESSKCAHSGRMRQCCRMNMSVCARKKIPVCSRHLFAGTCLFAHGERSKCACGVRTQQSCRMNISLCLVCGRRSKWRGFRVCSRSSCPDVLLNMSPRKALCAAGIPRVLGWKLPGRVIEHHA